MSEKQRKRRSLGQRRRPPPTQTQKSFLGLTGDMIKNNEDLVLMFNPFICEKRKIPMKLEREFVKLSEDIIAHVPEANTQRFVIEAQKVFNNISTHSFFSVSEMVEVFHSAVKQNSVGA